MFEHWDFFAQMQNVQKGDYRAPKSIEHLFSRHYSRWQNDLIKQNVPDREVAKFEAPLLNVNALWREAELADTMTWMYKVYMIQFHYI